MVGTYGRVLFPDAENPDFISSLLAFGVLPVFIATLFLIAVLAAIISTTDTYIHTLTATVVRDCVRTLFWPTMDDSQEFRLNRTITIGAAGVCVFLASSYPVLITPLAIFAGGITVQLLPPLVGAVTWSRASTEAALVAPAVGILLTLKWEMGILPGILPPPFAPALPGLAVAFFINVFLFIGISYLTKPQPPEQVEEFHGLLAKEL